VALAFPRFDGLVHEGVVERTHKVGMDTSVYTLPVARIRRISLADLAFPVPVLLSLSRSLSLSRALSRALARARSR
jgi:hypothetical protein